MKQSLETATFAGGCFWCLEAVFDELRGVESVESGYSGGHVENPGYRQVCTGMTGHAEAVQVRFDPQMLSYRDLLNVFFAIHDPTTLNRQGPDTGTQYRSAIFFHDERQRTAYLGQAHRDGSCRVRTVLCGGRLPSRVLCQQSLPAILHGCGGSQSGQVPQALRGSAEETACLGATGPPVHGRWNRGAANIRGAPIVVHGLRGGYR